MSDASTSQLAAVATTLVSSGQRQSGDRRFGSTATFSATLKAGATPLANRKVTFTLGAASLDDTTDSNGVASATFSLLAVPDGYTLAAGFLGDASDLGSGDSHAFTITKGSTTLALTTPGAVVANGLDSGVSAKLTDANHAPIPFKTIFFALSGAKLEDGRRHHWHEWHRHARCASADGGIHSRRLLR